MLRKLAFHPLPFALYPILFLFAHNTGQFADDQVQTPLVVVAVATAIVWLVLGIIVGDWRRAAIVTSLAALFFFSYGYAYSLVANARIGGFEIGRHRYLLAVWGAAFVAGAYGAIRYRADLGAITRALNFVSIILVVFPLTQIAAYEARRGTTGGAALDVPDPTLAAYDRRPSPPADSLPDIYYLILDGYGSRDVLRTFYRYDNGAFIDSLTRRGFSVANDSKTNYNQTMLSLSSSMNLMYLDGIIAAVGKESTSREPLQQLVQESRLYRFLKRRGYRVVVFHSDVYPQAADKADLHLRSPHALDEFSAAVLRMTPVPGFFGTMCTHSGLLWRIGFCDLSTDGRRRNDRLDFFARLKTVPDLPSPKFVFGHVFLPHPPFLFGPNGERVVLPDRDSPRDGSQFYEDGGTRRGYFEGYSAQVTFVNRKALEAVDAILARSRRPAVIILQGDHGPGMLSDWKSLENTNVHERFGVLNAYYFPGGDRGVLYPGISPVNSFRVVLNRYFGTAFPLLEDRSYYATWDRPYDLADVTLALRGGADSARVVPPRQASAAR